MYVLRLATEVDWDSEQDCFQTFCRETAKFFSIRQNSLPNDEVGDIYWHFFTKS